MECWHYVETTSSGQPLLRENEKDILIDHKIGLYYGKSRILNRQSGRIFLTSQRLIYVDDLDPTKYSICLELNDIESVEYSSNFLKRSARMILFLKDLETAALQNKLLGIELNKQIGTSTWVCPICMFTNEVQGEFTKDLNPLPVCENCGIPADYEMTKSSINYSNNSKNNNESKIQDSKKSRLKGGNTCPACTFINHPQMNNCEICGFRLPNTKIRSKYNSNAKTFKDSRFNIELENGTLPNKEASNFVQFSFRKSDGLLFSQATKKAVDDLRKEKTKHIFNADLVSVNGELVNTQESKNLPFLETKPNKVGITSLENSREVQLLNNDILFNNALTDLNKLMSLASEIEKLYKTYRKNGDEETKQKSVLMIDRDKFYNKSLFLDEIAREIYEFAIFEFKQKDESQKLILVTLVDLYAMYNKSMRIGIGYISPKEMKEACERFEDLGLHELKLTRINGRVLCLSSSDSFENIKEMILKIIESCNGCDLLQLTKILNESSSNCWTIGVITEIIQNSINTGDILIDEQLSGINYYKNTIWNINK
ncbi:hypothetical protein Kpol_1055p53 [Vanderwaltozyma polyspora DSM 70294]|uniref:Vacuolar protein-sorting-associated protein 36 n=1 Tax=Vanderwaltozyma polyspora (strain ATCC 22028 / DSM 70294 / BCRC 21397 / CBS 2163 / NBRC 10782 / NRRL Y-8283 / UCD 57-17) TaxID=436907 RepID=A7TGC6_VANPO|nr:uncharacterized protein Kpol_1055p53 [Vanderwaltozyma polyspora DSM 70294]EDO18696.1 hypothetical protein Kpol_1055p53 [Vanderwaltozyma polyspora DSM 70294]